MTPTVIAVVPAEREPIKPLIRLTATEMRCPYCDYRLVEVDNPMRREIRHERGAVCDGAPFGPPTEWKRPCPAGCNEGVCGGEHDGATAWYCQTCWSDDSQKGTGTITVPLTCEWCVGYGFVLGEPDHYERGTDAVIDCPDCVNGAPIIEIKVPTGSGVHLFPGRDPDRLDCYRTVRVSITVVPILEMPPGRGYPPFPRPAQFMWISRAKPPALRLVDDIAQTDIYLGPADTAKPGDFAIIGTPTEET